MNAITSPYLDSQTVAQSVLTHLWQRQEAGSPDSLHITGSPLLLEKLWSTLYFLTVIDAGERRELVAKIAHFPDQTTPEVSWQSAELLVRGQREFDTLNRVFAHFAQQPDPLLTALHAQAYLPEINAVVMDFVSGQALYDECLVLRQLLSAAGRRRAEQVMQRVGQWLRWFHQLPLDNVPPERIFGPADAVTALTQAANRLRPFGVNPDTWPRWSQTLSVLSQATDQKQVWAHGDFHLRNVLVVAPQDAVLGFDTALERVDSPYLDLGKFVADLKTRRAMIMRGGLLPPPAVIRALSQAFLNGYLAGEPLDILRLSLYEGRFIFEKWVESLSVIREKLGRRTAPGAVSLANLLVNFTFQRIINQWMTTINHNPVEIRTKSKLWMTPEL